MQKKYFWGVNFIFLRKKTDFFGRFSAFYGQRSVTAAWATGSPWSIFCICYLLNKQSSVLYFFCTIFKTNPTNIKYFFPIFRKNKLQFQISMGNIKSKSDKMFFKFPITGCTTRSQLQVNKQDKNLRELCHTQLV